jgi:hypothetical protein
MCSNKKFCPKIIYKNSLLLFNSDLCHRSRRPFWGIVISPFYGSFPFLNGHGSIKNKNQIHITSESDIRIFQHKFKYRNVVL